MSDKTASPVPHVTCPVCRDYCPWDSAPDDEQIIGGTPCVHTCTNCNGLGLVPS